MCFTLNFMNNTKKQYKEIIISNGAEAFRNIIEKTGDKKEISRRLSIEHSLSQRALFWGEDNKILITPYPIDPFFLETNSTILKYQNVKNVFPKKIKISLCEAIVNDRSLFAEVIGFIKSNPNISITSYAVTEEYLILINKLRCLKLKFKVSELPCPENIWTVQYLDSKSGFREQIYKIKCKENKINLPFGFICKNKSEAIHAGQWFLTRNKSCVLKSNFGESSWGLKILNKKSGKGYCGIELLDGIWEDTIIVVEEYIETNKLVAGGSPSIEVYVDDKGSIVTYLCGQIFDDLGSFVGVELGRDVIDRQTFQELKYLGEVVGNAYWEFGYRGYFDLDTIISKKKREIYLIETNTRRTGGTHVFDTAKRLLGNNWENERYLISNDQFVYGESIFSPNILIEKIQKIIYPIGNHKTGVILTIIDEKRPVIGYVIIGKNQVECVKIYDELRKLVTGQAISHETMACPVT